MPHKATIHDRLPFGVSLSQYGIAVLWKVVTGQSIFRSLLILLLQFPDRLIRI